MGINIERLKQYDEYTVFSETRDDRVKIAKLKSSAELRSAQLDDLINRQIEIDLGGKLAVQAGYNSDEVKALTKDKAANALGELGWDLSSLTPPTPGVADNG